MTTKILKGELLNMEQLDTVAGGNDAQNKADRIFFQKLGYNMARMKLGSVFAENGVLFGRDFDGDNMYCIEVDGKWTDYPHWQVLGFVLMKRNHPGFYGSWTDERNVRSFLKENFGINDLG